MGLPTPIRNDLDRASVKNYSNAVLTWTVRNQPMVTVNSAIELDWTKCEAGYKLDHEIVEKKVRRQRSVWARPANGSSAMVTASTAVTKIRPFDNNTGLYAVFANYPRTPEGIRAFCNDFGLLRYKQEHGGRHSLLLDQDLQQQRLMKKALIFRDQGDLAEAAAIINAAAPTIQPRIHLDPDGRMRMSWQPPTLLAAMWLQFALDLAGSVTIRSCAREGCSKPVITGSGTGRRSSARYCSSTCRYATHYARRQNKRRSAELHANAQAKGRRKSKSTVRTRR
jgi:hypothetical protein